MPDAPNLRAIAYQSSWRKVSMDCEGGVLVERLPDFEYKWTPVPYPPEDLDAEE